jgi:hypothetical protein
MRGGGFADRECGMHAWQTRVEVVCVHACKRAHKAVFQFSYMQIGRGGGGGGKPAGGVPNGSLFLDRMHG